MTRLFTLLILMVAFGAKCQLPPPVQPITWYASAFAFDGTNISNSGSPEVSWQGQATLEVWPYNYSNHVAVMIGKRSHSYTHLIDLGTNTTLVWPPIVPQTVYAFYYGGQLVTTSTSQPPSAMFKAFIGQSNMVNIGISTDGLSFQPFKILTASNGAFTITKQ